MTIIANTIDAAPRKPDHATSRHCRSEEPNGKSSRKTAAGLARNVKNNAITKAGKNRLGSRSAKGNQVIFPEGKYAQDGAGNADADANPNLCD